jgi:hypothetical protein
MNDAATGICVGDYPIWGMDVTVYLWEYAGAGYQVPQNWRRRGGVVRFEKRSGRAGTRRSFFLLLIPS